MKITATVSTRLPPLTVQIIDDLVDQGKFHNRSTGIATCVQMGLQVKQYQEMAKDPKKHDEFVDKMEELVETDKMSEWLEPMSDEQLQGVGMLIRMQLEKRHTQKVLL